MGGTGRRALVLWHNTGAVTRPPSAAFFLTAHWIWAPPKIQRHRWVCGKAPREMNNRDWCHSRCRLLPNSSQQRVAQLVPHVALTPFRGAQLSCTTPNVLGAARSDWSQEQNKFQALAFEQLSDYREERIAAAIETAAPARGPRAAGAHLALLTLWHVPGPQPSAANTTKTPKTRASALLQNFSKLTVLLPAGKEMLENPAKPKPSSSCSVLPHKTKSVANLALLTQFCTVWVWERHPAPLQKPVGDNSTR